jgi:hypothetical protein
VFQAAQVGFRVGSHRDHQDSLKKTVLQARHWQRSLPVESSKEMILMAESLNLEATMPHSGQRISLARSLHFLQVFVRIAKGPASNFWLHFTHVSSTIFIISNYTWKSKAKRL